MHIGVAVDATDFRPSINGVGGACASRRTVCESGRERWRDGAGCLPDLRISAPSVVACILARAVDPTDFRPSINGVGGACASRRTVWESGRERWRDGAGCYRTSGFRPPRSLHAYWRRRATTDFRPSINGVGGACASRRTVWESGRERWRDGAGCYRTLGFRPPRSLHAYWRRRRRDRFSTIDKRGRRCLREPAHGLGEWPRAMARRGRLLPDLRISAPSVVACILAWVGAMTDFRPSINGVGGACASRRTVVGEWPRAMARRGRLLPDLQDFGPLGRCMHIGLRLRPMEPISTIDKRGWRCSARAGARSGSGRERWRDGQAVTGP
jgi:hypothetical protein